MKEFRTEESANETVMGHRGMMLLEDPGSHKMINESFPSQTEAADNSQDASKDPNSANQRSKAAQRKRQRRPSTARDSGVPKSRRNSLSKLNRSNNDRRFSDSSTPRPSQRRRMNKDTLTLSFLTSLPDDHMFATASAPAVKSETLFTPSTTDFDAALSQPPYTSPGQASQQVQQVLDSISRPQSQGYTSAHQQQAQQAFQNEQQQQAIQQQQETQQQQHHQPVNHPVGYRPHQNQHLPPTSRPTNHAGLQHAFDFSAPTPSFPTEYFDSNLQSAVGIPAFGDHGLNFEPSPFSAPPFSMPGDQAAFGAVGF